MAIDTRDQYVVCETCGYTVRRFNGWAFCGPCKGREGGMYFHDYKPVVLNETGLPPAFSVGDDCSDETERQGKGV